MKKKHLAFFIGMSQIVIKMEKYIFLGPPKNCLGWVVTGWVKHLRVGLWPNQSLWKSRSVAFTKMKRNCFNCGMIITKGNLWRLNCKMCPWQYKNNSIFCYPGSDAQLQCIRLHLPRFGGVNIPRLRLIISVGTNTPSWNL